MVVRIIFGGESWVALWDLAAREGWTILTGSN
jgi:hypothetical protein